LTWNFTVEAPRTSAAAGVSVPGAAAPAGPAAGGAPPASSADPLNFSKLFEELDKFCNQILTIPGAVNHPEIKKQFDFIKASKEQMLLAHAESAVNRKIHQDQLAALEQGAKQRQEAHQKKLDELNKPLASLDGDALARALLKNVGLVN
jgi:hypothetical protein